MKTLMLLFLAISISTAQSKKAVEKKIVGYWEKTNEKGEEPYEMVFYKNGRCVVGNEEMRARGDWAIKKQEKGLGVEFSLDAAFGGDQQTIPILSMSKRKIDLQYDSNTSLELNRANKKAWKKEEMQKQVLGIWEVDGRARDGGMAPAMVVLSDSFILYDGGGPISGAWDMTPDGRYLVLKFAEEPMVSILAAAPGHYIMPLTDKKEAWIGKMERDTFQKPKNESLVEKKEQLLGTWMAVDKDKGLNYSREFKEDGLVLITMELEGNKDSREASWEISEEGKYMRLSSKGSLGFDISPLPNKGATSFKEGPWLFEKNK